MTDRAFQVYIKGTDPRPHFLAIYEPAKLLLKSSLGRSLQALSIMMKF